jgi:hypothetical protein
MNMRSTFDRRMLLLSVVVAGLMLPGRPAAAQRGADYVVQEPSREPASGGFPGLFDSYVAPRRALVVEVPTLAVDYGATENLTVGVSAGLSIAAIGGVPGGMAKLRYRVYSRPQLASVITVYGGGIAVLSDHSQTWFAAVGSNTSWYVTERHAVTLTLMGVMMDSRSPQEGTYFSITNEQLVSGLVVGGSYEGFLTRRFGLQLTAFTMPVMQGSLENEAVLQSIDIGASSSLTDRTFVRGMLELRTEKWLLTAGVMWGPILPFPIPLATAARRW